ncbi:MAG: hypothetical protein CVU38_00320 [Chloroflexi bacterium HGW-Chloroflexi-1]|nr:MAG: hypothetical protein CVU38_00320 [Chloroflexi bacterium HGW-Chloroflexi-1]
METTSFWTYIAILKKRLWVILLLFAATMTIILGCDWLSPPIYQSSLVLQLLPLEPEEVTLYTRLNTATASDIVNQIFFQFSYLVRSSKIAQQTQAETGIDVTADDLAASVSVVRDPWIDLLTVSVAAEKPEDAETLLVKQVELALEELRQSRARPLETLGRFLDAALAAADRELDAAQEELLRFKLANELEYVDREIIAEQDAIRSLIAAQEEANIEAQRLGAIVEALEQQVKDAQAQASAQAADGPEAQYMTKLAQDLNVTAVNRRVEAAGQRARAANAYALVAKHQTNLASLITIAGQYRQLVDAVQEKQDSRNFLAAKAREARLKVSQSRNIGYLQIISSPSTPRSQVATRTVRTALLGGGLSLVAGVVLAFVLEFLEQILRRTPRRQQEQA